MLSLSVVPMHQATEQETTAKLLRLDVPNTPIICCLTHNGILFFLNSILSRYYKPVHPSLLAFIVLSLEKFLFGIALSFWWRFCTVPAVPENDDLARLPD